MPLNVYPDFQKQKVLISGVIKQLINYISGTFQLKISASKIQYKISNPFSKNFLTFLYRT